MLEEGFHKKKTEVDERAQFFESAIDQLLGQRCDQRITVDYWQAQSFASRVHREFEESVRQGNVAGMKSRFYALIDYYNRAMMAFREGYLRQSSVLIVSSLRSLMALKTPIYDMYAAAPNSIPLPLTIDTTLKKQIIKDLLVKALSNSSQPQSIDALTKYILSHTFLTGIRKNDIKRLLGELEAKGHVLKVDNTYKRTRRVYKSTNLDDASLQAFLGREIYQRFERKGFIGISNIMNKIQEFHGFFEQETSCGIVVSELFVATVSDLLGTEVRETLMNRFHCRDLIGSQTPRPYQREAFSIFRAHGYQGHVIEAPTGSGKTLIGMMAIQDWLTSLSSGESILVLVPTVNYEQQWVRELCYNDIGLGLSPDLVYAGSPSAYLDKRKRDGYTPPVLIMTYTSLAQLGSPKGKGGFDHVSVEKFLQGANIRNIVLDEVHKVVENLQSVSAGVTRLLVDWLKDGSLEGLIGFSGTADAYRERFEEVGLKLVYVMPTADLIAYGFVAPFAELGIPFTHSDREKKVLALLDRYKELIRSYVNLLDTEFIKQRFAAIPSAERVYIARNVLGMYEGRKNRNRAIRSRLRKWERSGAITLNELSIITIIQVYEKLSDEALVMQKISTIEPVNRGMTLSKYEKIIHDIETIRSDLQNWIFYSDIVKLLKQPGFGSTFDFHRIERVIQDDGLTKASKRSQIRSIISTSIVGLFSALRSIYYRMGEGIVDSIHSIIRAESMARRVTGTIVFGTGKRIRWEQGTTNPGYAGVAGIFAQLLGKRNLKPLAVLSSEMYMPWAESNPIPLQISDFIRKKILNEELGEAFLSILSRECAENQDALEILALRFRKRFREFLKISSRYRAPPPNVFENIILEELRNALDESIPSEALLLKSRLTLQNSHIRKWLGTFVDYAIIAYKFKKPHLATLEQADGKVQKFFVVRMAQGDRKQLMYDLAARVVDAPELSLNTIIVSGWARTGWNVITPNLLIDATTTRNVTAWQQLRGRTMRALRTWNRECYELMIRLLGFSEAENNTDGSKHLDVSLEESEKKLLQNVHTEKQVRVSNLDYTVNGGVDLSKKISQGNLARFTQDERIQLAVELMESRNKVTHIYELVKAMGSNSQIRYRRRTNTWHRKQNIARKHSHSYSVHPFTGECSKGEAHAPLVYVKDPREHSPSQLKLHLAKLLREKDPLIIKGWIQAVLG